jgi:hypothetical protein
MRKQQPWLAAHGVTGKHEDVVVRRENAVDIVRRQLTDAKGQPKFTDPDDLRVIYASPLVDVAGNMELVRETVEICKVILTLTNWHIRLLSKSNLLPEVAKALTAWACEGGVTHPSWSWSGNGAHRCPSSRVIYGVSTGTLDDNLARAFEQGTPLVSKRIESLHWLQDNGYRTFGMVCPSLPQTAYHRFAANMASALRYDQCEHVWAEVINTRGDSFTRTHAALESNGFYGSAAALELVSTDKEEWEKYARLTFEAHTSVCPPGKLRFLQYVTNDTRPWWEAQRENGAVIL